ncbi:MAG: pilus assembly protein [Verrucomicrobia bacterium RIFCSPLOWO2_12_FULL_64_8]|nr:MAG: pilus assembly protein [Verrucomicrobia bacterium RIFCSPLOWO2_12_FULL_64_8]
MSVILADTGALVALLDRRERFHSWAVEQTRSLQPPLLTCDAVIAELCFLLADVPGNHDVVRQNLRSGVWRLDFSLAAEHERVFALMATYADQPMALADACLVRMAELHAGASVFTLDGHFRVYRRNRRQVIPVILPPET